MRSYKKKQKRNGRHAFFPNGIRELTVRRSPGKPGQGLINAGGTVFACALGRGGISAIKREGDGATPLASMRVLSGYFRTGRLRARPTRLAMAPIRGDLGWCDLPQDRNYNRPVRLPYPASHETMLRKDGLYDHCLVLDWNIRPRRRHRGSAIFLHLARPGFKSTEGCVAVTPTVMARLLAGMSARTVLRVTR